MTYIPPSCQVDLSQGEDALQAVRERRLLIDRYDSWLFDEIRLHIGQRVLEVGCGLGNLTVHLLDREMVVAIDLSNDSVTSVSARFSDYHNVQTFVLDITEPSVMQLAGFGFDTVISLNVLEHIREDIVALRHMRELVRPGGRVIAIVPALGWLYGSMDRSIGHYRRYNKDDLTRTMQEAGLEVEHQKYLNMLGVLGWFINGRMLKKQIPPRGQLRSFNSLVPAARLVEGLLSPPFGLSLLCIARRTHGGTP